MPRLRAPIEQETAEQELAMYMRRPATVAFPDPIKSSSVARPGTTKRHWIQQNGPDID